LRTLNYPVKYWYQNVNLIITDAYSQSAIMSPAINITSPAMTDRIARFIRENPDFSNLLPLNEPFGKRNIDIQLTWTALHCLTAVVRNFKSIRMIEEGEEWRGDFGDWVVENFRKDVAGDKPWVIWETPEEWSSQRGQYLDYEVSAWPQGDYVETFDPCGSCGISMDDFDPYTSCMNCGVSIHSDGDCGPWLDHGQDGGSGDYQTAVCVSCYIDETGEPYGGYNRLQRNFSQQVAEKITDEDIRQTLTFIEETFNTFEWK
jgi:hypothetical protein